MATLNEYFEREAKQYLARLGRLVGEAANAFGSGELHRTARALRGTAQMARQEAVYRIALALEIVARGGLSRMPAPADLSERLEETLADLRQLIDGSTDAATAERIAGGGVARWRELDPRAQIPTDALSSAISQPAARPGSDRAFLGFAAREVGALAEEMERSVAALVSDPLDREAVKRVLRQQRALLGSARLDEMPIVAETLRAVEDLARVIAKLDVPVKGEWLDVFRSARDVLYVAAPALAAREQPTATNALSRLRTLREELIDRYGAGEAVSVAPGEGLQQPTAVLEPPPPPALAERVPAAAAVQAATPVGPQPKAAAAPTQAARATQPPTTQASASVPVTASPGSGAAGAARPAPDAAGEAAGTATPRPDDTTVAEGTAEADVVDIEMLCYRGSAALRRALELRARFEAAVGSDPAASEVVAEVFDLIRLGLDE